LKSLSLAIASTPVHGDLSRMREDERLDGCIQASAISRMRAIEDSCMLRLVCSALLIETLDIQMQNSSVGQTSRHQTYLMTKRHERTLPYSAPLRF
jgi:hypothetical protein